MASRIITKKGSGAPLASDLVHGELAVDTVNKRLYTENAGGTVVEVGTAPSTIDINGGTIDDTVIGGTTPAAVTTTALVATTADINAGTIDGTVIGGSTAAAGSFTTGQFDTSVNVDGTVTADGLSVDTGNVLFKGGDISFYEDTGTTAKLYWDASAESLTVPTLITTGAATFGGLLTAGTANSQNSVFGTIIGSGGSNEGAVIVSSATGKGWLGFNNGNNASIPGQVTYDHATNILSLYSSGTVAVTGALTTTGAATFGGDIATPTRIAADTINGYTGGSTPLTIQTGGTQNIILGTNATERLRIDSSGNLLVGCTGVPSASTPGFAVRDLANGWIHTSYDTTNPRTHHNFFNSNGSVGTIQTSASSTLFNTSSDQRLKENITDANDAGDKIDAIKVRQYDWKADGSHQDYGMVAQELMTVALEAVSGDPESDEMMGVDYSKLVPMMLKEIQSLRARVAQLEGAN